MAAVQPIAWFGNGTYRMMTWLGYTWPDMSRLRLLVSWTSYVPSRCPLGRLINGAVLAFAVFSTVSITAAQGAMLLALSAWLVHLVWVSEWRRLYLPLIAPMVAFALASVLATLTAIDPYRSLIELRNFFLPSFFFLMVNHLTDTRHASNLTKVVIAMGSVMALYGLSQSLMEGEAFRIRGTMGIWMTFAGIMMLLATVTLAYLLFTPERRAWYWLFPSFLLLTAALVMTHTRGAWLGFTVGVAIILACRKRLFLLLLPILLIVTFVAAPEAVRERLRSIVDPADVTARERLYMWGSGLRMIRDHPWTGVGLDGVKGAYPAYRNPRATEARWGHLHNNFIQVTVERGFLGLACWLWIWVVFYRDTWRTYRALGDEAEEAKGMVVGGLAAVSAFHVEGLFEYTFGDSEVITLVYFLMAIAYLVRRVAPVERNKVDVDGVNGQRTGYEP